MIVPILVGMAVLFILVFGGLWIGSAIGLAATVTGLPTKGIGTIASMIAGNTWTWSQSFTLAAVPLFMFMGELVTESGLMTRVYHSLTRLMGTRVPGSLLQPLILTCTVFGACSGSATASTAMFTRIAYPDLVNKRKYSSPLTTGAIAAGGSLSSLVPPSIVFIVYGEVAEVSVGKMFAAGFIPGAILGMLFMLYVALRVIQRPNLAPLTVGAHTDMPIWKAVVNTGPLLLLILLVLGAILLGVATPTEAAALGVLGASLVALANRRLNWGVLLNAARNAIVVTAMVYFIAFAAKTFTMTLNFYHVTTALQNWALSVQTPLVVFMGVSVLYLIMGCLFESISILLVTVPFVVPPLVAVGYDPIFLGVMITVLIMIGLLTPPVGTNLFVVHGTCGAPLEEVIRGSLPFAGMMVVMMILIYVFPQLALWLPSLM